MLPQIKVPEGVPVFDLQYEPIAGVTPDGKAITFGLFKSFSSEKYSIPETWLSAVLFKSFYLNFNDNSGWYGSASC